MKKSPLILAGSIFAAVASSAAAATLVSLASFGGGDGWRAPGEILTGDTAGTATAGSYNYLGTANNERGFAYNPITGNLIVASRSSAGNGIRILSGTTGADLGALPQGVGIISGGTFAINAVATSTDGAIYVGNLTADAVASNFKVYSWSSETASAPTVAFNSAIAVTPSSATNRLGDDLDAFGSSGSLTLVAGAGSANVGYVTISGGTATRVQTFTPASIGVGDFRHGITFAGAADQVWGKELSNPLQRSATSGAFLGTTNLTSAGEGGIDYATIDGIPYLATIDVNSSLVRVYDVTDPAVPLLVASTNVTSGVLTGNGNGSGNVKWGATSASGTTLYAMSTNQGIVALNFVPEPSALVLGLTGFGVLLRRRRM